MRVKEGSSDYRYFPEPDLPLYDVSDEWIEEMRQTLPEFPKERRAKYINEFGLTAYDAAQLTATKATSDFFESAVALGGDAKHVSNWLQGEVAQFLNSENKTLSEILLTPENLVEMLAIIADGTISSKIAKKVFVHLAKMVVLRVNTLKKLVWFKFLTLQCLFQLFTKSLKTMKLPLLTSSQVNVMLIKPSLDS